MTKMIQNVTENAPYLLSFVLVVVGIFALAVLLEKASQKKNGEKQPVLDTRKMAMIGMFSAVAAILMYFEFPMPFAPGFYELDFSEIPILVGSFAFGPVAGVTMEFIKVVLKLFIKGTSTAFIGDFANFMVGCSFILPASAIYSFKKGKKNAIISCVVGTVILTLFGTAFNAVYLLPAFAKFYGWPLEDLLAMGTAVNPFAKEGDIVSFVIACVAPLNLIKGSSVSVATMLIYKPLSPIIKTAYKR